jgi:hypothetical protein
VATKRRSKRGRPKGSTGGGRPVKDLSPDPWRYLYAFASLAIDRKPIGTSELSICNVFVALMYGRPLKDGESIVDHRGAAVKTATEVAEAMRAGAIVSIRRRWDDLPAHSQAALRKYEPHPSANGSWSDNEFQPFAENLRKRLNYLRNAKPTNLKRRHFAGLRFLLCVCFDAPERADFAASVADQIGERPYWETTLRPLIARRAAGRAAGKDEPSFGDLLDAIEPWRAFVGVDQGG